MSGFESLRTYNAERVLVYVALTLGLNACSASKLVGRDNDEAGTAGVGGTGASGGSGTITGGEPSLGGNSAVVPGTGGAVAATGGAVAATGGAVAATGGAVAATGGAAAATGGAAAATGGAVAATGGAVAATGGAVAATGGTTGCAQLSCLAGHRFLYQANRAWQHPNLGAWDPLPESEYAPVTDAPKYLLQFSATGTAASLAEIVSTQYPDPYGTLDGQNAASLTYGLKDGWTGERFIVSQTTDGLDGDLTFWGSGVPIVEATRGPLELTQAYANQADVCGLPLGVMPTWFPVTYEDAVAAGSDCGKVCVGLRNGYCKGDCAGYLVWEDRCNSLPASVAYDPVTHALVGYVWGNEAAPICRGHFPPHAADGTKGWDMSHMDLPLTCD